MSTTTARAGEPEFAPLPISRWGQTWRVLVVLLISAAAWTEAAIYQWQHLRWWFWLDLAVGAATFAAMFWRRRHPLAVALVTNAVTVGSFSAGGPATLTLFSLSTRRRWREIAPAAVVALGAGLVNLRSAPGSQEDDFVVTAPALVAIIAIIIAWGMYVGSRRELLASLRDRAETAEREQAARVAQARTGERTRIAREMHDVLAHRISTVTMHAGALTYREDLTTEQMRATAEVIQDNARQALVELREVLGLLREDPGDAAPERPQPGAGDLDALIVEARVTGLHVSSAVDVDPTTVPPMTGRTAYRVVQEGLTNVRKHATHTAVTVDVTGQPGHGLEVVVRNKLPLGRPVQGLPPSGLGLIGLRERVELAGGRLERKVTPDRDFVLSAWLPWPA